MIIEEDESLPPNDDYKNKIVPKEHCILYKNLQMDNLLKFAKIVRWDNIRKAFTYKQKDLQALDEEVFTCSAERLSEGGQKEEVKEPVKSKAKQEAGKIFNHFEHFCV